MGTLTNALMRVLLSWVRGFVSLLWSIAQGGDTGLLTFFRKSWLPLCVILIVFGLVTDYLVWLFRYKPYLLLAARFRQRHAEREDPPEPEKARPALEPPQEKPQPAVTPQEEREILRESGDIPDSALRAYPGRRYQESAPEPTRHFAAADEKSETQRFRLRQEAETPVQEQTEAEADYARRLAEYERKKAQYELDMAEYEKKMEAYRAAKAAPEAETSAAEPAGGAPKRRRRGAE